MGHWRPDVGFVFWGDEIDKMSTLWKKYIPKLRSMGNVIQVNGITATPYLKYWDLIHSLDLGDIPLIGTLPDASDYRTISHHKMIYTNNVKIISPVKNFQYLLAHPGELCYTDTDTSGILTEHRIPTLNTNTKAILYIPGEVATRTHDAIADIANKNGKNALVINGKFKGFRYADGRPSISVIDYKDKMIALGIQYKEDNGDMVSYLKVPYMDIARSMYNDPALGLKNMDLVITGFNCITRGITFNSPTFQFDYVILSEYHYKDGSKQVEEIIQAVGRSHGNVAWVKEGINFLSPKYIIDMVEQKINEMIEFLRSAPKEIKYADIYRETKAIPIKIVFLTSEIIKKINEFGNLTKKKRVGFMNILRDGLDAGAISLHDPNSVNSTQLKFSFADYELGTKRILHAEDAARPRTTDFSSFWTITTSASRTVNL